MVNTLIDRRPSCEDEYQRTQSSVRPTAEGWGSPPRSGVAECFEDRPAWSTSVATVLRKAWVVIQSKPAAAERSRSARRGAPAPGLPPLGHPGGTGGPPLDAGDAAARLHRVTEELGGVLDELLRATSQQPPGGAGLTLARP